MRDEPMQSSRVDTRGFTYALTPYLRKQEWQLELLESRFAQSHKDLEAARREREDLDAVFAEQISRMRGQTESRPRPDPQMRSREIGYLAGLRAQMKLKDEGIKGLRMRRDELQEQLITQQRMIDGLLKHRSDAFKEFVEEKSRHQAAQADRDWIGRAISRWPLGKQRAHGERDWA